MSAGLGPAAFQRTANYYLKMNLLTDLSGAWGAPVDAGAFKSQSAELSGVLRMLVDAENEEKNLVWMIPSENSISPLTRLATASAAQNRYLFKYRAGDQWLHFGTQGYFELHEYCVAKLQELFKAKYVSLAPLSGMHAMSMVIASFTAKDEPMYAIAVDRGGHTHTRAIVDVFGRTYRDIPFRGTDGWYDIDTGALRRMLDAEAGRALVYLDPMTYPYKFDLEQLRAAAPAHAFLYYDTSHVMGLIAGGVYANPLDHGFDAFGGSLHKTFPGVQKAVFLSNDEEHYRRFQKRGEQLVSSKHSHAIAALAVALSELDGKLDTYANAIVANNRALRARLAEHGFTFYGRDSGDYDGHMLLLRRRDMDEAIRDAEKLYRIGIVVHPLRMPLEHTTAGLRLGVQECTALGMGVAEMRTIADIFAAVLDQGDSAVDVRRAVRTLVDFRRASPLADAEPGKFDDLFKAMFC